MYACTQIIKSIIELCKTQKTADMGIIDHLFN